MKTSLSFILLALLALPLAYAASSASFSTDAASLPEKIEMEGHFGNYTLVAFATDSNVTVAVLGAQESRSALVSEIGWLTQNGKFYSICNVSAMPEGQEAYCGMNGTWAQEKSAVPAPAMVPAPTSAPSPSEDSGAFNIASTGAARAPSEALAMAGAQPPGAGAQPQGIGGEQVLQLLGAFLAVIVASYLILQSRQAPLLDAATEKLLDNPTRAGIMEELSSADKIPTDISLKLGKSKAAVVEHLAALGDAGLVERIATPGKKFVFYKLTQKGRQVLLRKAG